MQALDKVISVIDRITELFGKLISWLVLYMVLMTFANVVMRYVFGISIIALYESVLYAFAISMTALAGWALMRDQHVRVDIFYGAMRPRGRALVNIAGTVFLLAPMLWVLWSRSIPYVERSWKLRETSNEVAGLDYLYVLKTFMLVFVALLAFQAVSFLLKNLRIAVLGHDPDAPLHPDEI
ncbi:TRAP transporter small permease subunit [Lutimaribacter marinistellae]|uniref:TRAP transporter small permease protein n=1 Tax=Lutimaribacter marinistellae TaxID=1820329 RepID=A0ABV7TDV7_9RHOB